MPTCRAFTPEAFAQSVVAFGDEVRCTVSQLTAPPLFVQAQSAALRDDLRAAERWFAQHRNALEQALLTHGAVVFRDFPIRVTDDFATFVQSLPKYQQGYAGGAQRRKTVKGDVMEASPSAPDFYIPLHQEMSYLPKNPRLIAFFCRKAADTGGATLIADMRRVTAELPAALRERLQRLGVRYTRNLIPPGTSDARSDPKFNHNTWSANFGTEDRAQVEALCRERGLHAEWQVDGSLNLINTMPGFIDHPTTGDRLYFNQLHAQALSPQVYGRDLYEQRVKAYAGKQQPFNSSFGDGTPVTQPELDAVHDTLNRLSVNSPWHDGEVMIVENKLTAHGRDRYSGHRDVQVAMFD